MPQTASHSRKNHQSIQRGFDNPWHKKKFKYPERIKKIHSKSPSVKILAPFVKGKSKGTLKVYAKN